MPKNKTSITVATEYVLLLFLIKTVKILPEKCIKPIAAVLGRILWWILPKRRKIINKNLSLAFPHKPSSYQSRIAHDFWPQFCSMILSYVRLNTMPAEKYDRYFHSDTEHYLQEAYAKHKGVIIVSAHYAVWELLGMWLSVKGYQAGAIARPLDNPLINRLINGIRESSGMKVIPHRQAVKESLKLLKERKGIGFVMDQNFHHGGVFINFFNKPASITDLPALLSLKTGAPLVPVHCVPEKPGYRVFFDPPLFPAPGQTSQEVSQQLGTIMEEWIIKEPLYWLWAHDRWKRQPSQN